MIRLAVLVSGRGSNLRAILEAIAHNKLDAQVEVVWSSNEQAPACGIAREFGVPVCSGDASDQQKILDDLSEYEIDWVVLAGFERILSSEFLRAYPERVINIHPSLLPAFPGLGAQGQALQHGVKVTGCTVHFVDEGIDTGKIIAQKAVEVKENDTEETLAARILREEHRLLPQVLQVIAQDRVGSGTSCSEGVFKGDRDAREARGKDL